MINIFKKLLKSNWIFKAIIFILVIAVFFVNAKFVIAAPADSVGTVLNGAGTALGPVGNVISLVLGIIAYILTAVIGLLITVVVALLIQVAQFNNIINVPTVITGWVIIRDLCNMSFILILLIIAFATILRQENFSAKKMLPKLLIMAILINFSRTIFGLLVDASQIIMLTFVNAFAAGGGWFVDAFKVDQWYKINAWSSAGSVTSWSTVVAVIAGVLAAIITLIVVSVMLAVLVARIVMLWIYTIFSPLVFLGFAFPPLQKYTGKIWEDFTKQLVVGPVLAFFIWLALTTAQSSSNLLTDNSITAQGVNGVSEICVGAGAFFCQGNLQKFIIVIGLLMGGLMVAQSMGGAAGSIAGKGLDWAKKSMMAPAQTAGGIAKTWGPWASRKMAKISQKGGLWSLAMLGSPRTLKEGWERRRKEDEQEAFPRASAKFQDFLNKRFNPLLGMGVEGKGKIGEKTARMKQKLESIPYLGPIARAASGKKTYNEKIAFESEVASKQNEIAKANMSEVQAAQAMYGARGEIEKLAWTRQIMALNRQDDVAKVLGEQFNITLPGLEKFEKTVGELKGAFNKTAWREYLKNDYFREFGKQKADEFMAHLAEYAEDIGKPRGYSMGAYDSKTGKAVSIDTVEEANGLLNMRLSRSAAEDAATKIEPAQTLTQLPEAREITDIVTGKKIKSIFAQQDAERDKEGLLNYKTRPNAVCIQYNESRKAQAREVRAAGIEVDEKTGHANADTIDYFKLAIAYSLNKVMAEASLAKSKFSNEDMIKIQDNLRIAMVHPRVIDELNKMGESPANVDFLKSPFAPVATMGKATK